MKYFLLYQWPLRPCRNHLNPNMMLAKNLLWNNLMYVLINSSPSNFFFFMILRLFQSEAESNSCHVNIYNSWMMNLSWYQCKNFSFQLWCPDFGTKGTYTVYMYWTCQPVCQSLARPNVVLLSIISWKPFAW